MTTPDPYTPGAPDQGGTPPASGAQQPTPQQPAPQYPAQPAPGPAYPAAPAGQYPAGQYPPGYGMPPENPGKTLGIVGLVLGFLGPLSLVGLILSIVGLSKSRKVGQSNGVAVAGIVVSSLVLIGVIIGAIVMGIGIAHVLEMCAQLGPGTHVDGGVTYTCS